MEAKDGGSGGAGAGSDPGSGAGCGIYGNTTNDRNCHGYNMAIGGRRYALQECQSGKP